MPVNANRKVKEPYAPALNHGSSKVIETLKTSYAHEGWGCFFARTSLAIVTLQRESKKGAVTISKCHFLKFVFLDTETSKWFLSVSPKYTLPHSQGMA